MENQQLWQRAILLVDMNAFFASIEQRDFPQLRGRPVAVTNGKTGTCIITSSYEARAWGITTGMRLKEGRKLCPDLIQRPARPRVYAKTSQAITQALEAITPDIEVFSVDEAFLDVTHCQRLHGSVERITQMAQQVVADVSGVGCSIGASSDKTTAKFAAKLDKPNGITIIPPWQAENALKEVPVTKLCGINKGIGKYLADRNVVFCGDMQKLPISELGKRFGNIGRRIWLMAQAADPDTLHQDAAPPKSIGHGKVMPPETKSREVISMYITHMAAKVAQRLRRHNLFASVFFAGLRANTGWIGTKCKAPGMTNSTIVIHDLCKDSLMRLWQGEGVSQIQINALNPGKNIQPDLFKSTLPGCSRVDAVVDAINDKYGQFCIAPARMLGRSEMPDVISPAWKPEGIRQTIDN